MRTIPRRISTLAAHERSRRSRRQVEREVGGLDMAAQREPGDERVVFIVGMRADDQHARSPDVRGGLVAPGRGGAPAALGVEWSDQQGPRLGTRVRGSDASSSAILMSIVLGAMRDKIART